MKNLSRTTWIKITAVALIVYVHTAGLLFDVPRLNILNETVRALYFHVPMWFGMSLLLLLSAVLSVRYLYHPSSETDIEAVECANVGTFFGVLGMITGMIWARYTWGAWWHGDPKQNTAAISLLIYFGYFIVRSSIENRDQRARISASLNIFAFISMVVLLFVIPRLTSSMHPGSGGNPGFNVYDLDSRMLLVFYPAVGGWFILGLWISSLRIRMRTFEENIFELEHEKAN